MLRRRRVVQAVGAPVAVQLRGGRAPHLAFLRVGGDGAEFGQQPGGRVQGQGALVDPPPPGSLPRHRPLLDAQVGVVGFQPAQVPLLRPPQHPQPPGGLVGLPGRGSQRVLGQHQPVPGGLEVPPMQQPALEGGDRLSGLLLVRAGLLAGLLGVGGPPGGQVELPRAVRRARSAQRCEPVALGAQLGGGQPPHVGQVGGVAGQGLAAVTRQHPPEQLLRRPRFWCRVGAFLVGAQRLRADRKVQVRPVGAAGELHVAALHVLDPVQRQQRPPLGAALRPHVGAGVGEVHPARLPGADGGVQVPAGQPHHARWVVLHCADGHGPAGHVQLQDDGGGAVDHAQALPSVGAQHHHIPDRKRAIPDGEPLGAELAVLSTEPLAHLVELVDLGAAVGVDHRLLAGLVRLPPVGHQRPIAVVSGLERLDAVVLGIGGDRPLQVAGADVVDRPLLPFLHLAAVDREFGGAQAHAEGAEAAAGLPARPASGRSAPSAWRTARSTPIVQPHDLGRPRALIDGPPADPQALGERRPLGGQVQVIGGHQVGVQAIAVERGPAPVGALGGVLHQHVGVELGVA
jgi:hypothetical protein